MNNVTRQKAIKHITAHSLKLLTAPGRESLLLDWWTLDKSDNVFSALSKKLQESILNNDEPPKGIEHLLADELIMVGLTLSYKGVTNTYLADRLNELECEAHEITGDVEPLNACPCCGYRTLSTTSNYEICDLCKWEDDGTSALESYSHPNHMTLSDAKKAFCGEPKRSALNKWIKASYPP
jgi:hypothetical protein